MNSQIITTATKCSGLVTSADEATINAEKPKPE